MSATIDFGDPAIKADPYPLYRELRREQPVFWNGQGWFVFRYDDVLSLFNDPRISSARTGSLLSVLPRDVQRELEPMRAVLSSRMLLTDPPAHTRLRNLLTKAFSAKAASVKRERIQALCDQLLAGLLPCGELELMEEFASPLPSYVIADMLGVELERQADFARWSRAQVRIYDRPGTLGERVAVMRQGQAAMLETKAYLEAVIAARRRQPREDLITLLIEAEEAGDRLTTAEMVVMIIALLVGGNNSTAHLIGNAILTLLRHPESLARLRAEPALIRLAIEEVLRFECPVQTTSRVAKERIELGGQAIEAGQNVFLVLASANRDESQFPEPDRFDITRQPNRHLDFAHGPHFCLGSAIARAEAQIAVNTLIQRCPDLELAAGEIEWLDGFSFRGPKRLPLRVGAE
ncbi:MAG TPA: cytochrome P450 [Thermomicrobiaceae bacterium]|nr:cytochrome P450 [Thermomicrobiaceae bacterium]